MYTRRSLPGAERYNPGDFDAGMGITGKHLAYIQSRTEDGSLDRIRTIVTEEPNITYKDNQDL